MSKPIIPERVRGGSHLGAPAPAPAPSSTAATDARAVGGADTQTRLLGDPLSYARVHAAAGS